MGFDAKELPMEVTGDTQLGLTDFLGGGLMPTFISLDQEIIRSAIDACDRAIENTNECLVEHERSLGRTTTKNRRLAEIYEDDVKAMKRSRNQLRQSLGWPEIE